ncbi:MAG TPA: Rap1a/Tai family immunity protein [Acetobacteraceae bacterium]|nr:Rap1a/Tai family immunity protein [Acetobacteraceae bacterium]
MKPLALLAATACLALPMAAHAQRPINLHARTAGELAELCGANPREPGGAAKLSYCHGFAQGVVDVELQHAGNKRPFCFPNPAPTRAATLGQFVEWARASPEHRSEGAVDGLMHFLAERYPCK